MRRTQAVSLICALGTLACATSAQASGLLLPREGTEPLALRYHRVNVETRDGTAVTRVEQVFTNRTGRDLEATYLFPLPEDAVIVDFRLMVNGEMKKGEVLPRERAAAIYEGIVRRMKDPGLVEWMGKGLFQARIYPVPAGGDQRVELTYTQVLPYLDGAYKLVYPLRTPGTASRTLEDMTLTVKLAHVTPIRGIYSPSHRISVQRKGERQATVGFEGERAALDTDFVLYFNVSAEDVGLQVLSHRPPGEPGYFMVLASPRAVFDGAELPRKNVTFVLDTSGSMAGGKLEDARRALTWCLDQLGPGDRFNVIRFSSDVESLSETSQPADVAHLAEARAFVAGFEAAGGTAIDAALEVALADDPGQVQSDAVPHIVLFITDGRPTVGETARDKILERARRFDDGARTRLFAFGVGEELDTLLLDRLSSEHGGTSSYLGADDDLDRQISGLYGQLAYPVVTDLRLEVRNVTPYAMLPRELPDLFKGQQLVVLGRYRKAGDALIRLHGRMGGRERTWDFEAPLPERREDQGFVASIWAHRQVGFLLDAIREGGETPELREEVVQLATRYGIVTPYTSYLVTEDETRAVEDRAARDRPARPSPPPRPLMLDGELRRKEAERSVREAFGGGAGGAPGASGNASRPAPREAPEREVAKARVLKHYQAKKSAEEDTAGLRHVAGRAFRWTGGAWVDTAIRDGAERIRVAPYSDAWWRLLALRPELKSALALGERVSVWLGDLVVEVRPGAPSTLTSSEERKLAR
ncbi:MAG: VWA domain-containing protein [Deltaproteobacteria bacterium]|nr:VWA domain-containing protein [Deltaproteobacteria bacterium]